MRLADNPAYTVKADFMAPAEVSDKCGTISRITLSEDDLMCRQYQYTKGVSDSCPLPIILEYTHTHTRILGDKLLRTACHLPLPNRRIQIQSLQKAFPAVHIQSEEKLTGTLTPTENTEEASLTQESHIKPMLLKHRVYTAGRCW